jgi:hypothetical protein
LVVALVSTIGYLFVKSSHASNCALGAKMVPTCGALWGMDPSSTSLATVESELGREMAIVHTYHRWTVTFPNSTESAETASGSGRILLADWITVSPSGVLLPWTSITNGSQDSVIDTEAAALKSYGQPLFMTFVHEMDSNMNTGNPSNYMGTPAQYKAAYQYVYNRLVNIDHVTNVVWIYDVTGDTAYQSDWTAAYPGNNEVDWIASDPYNWYTCHNEGWKDFAQTVSPSYNLLTADFPGKPYAVVEYNTPEGSTASMKADFFTNEAAQAQADLPDLHMAVYFNSASSNPECDGQINTSSESLAGFKAAGLDPFFNPQLTSTPTSTPTPARTPVASQAPTLMPKPQPSQAQVPTQEPTARPTSTPTGMPGPLPTTIALAPPGTGSGTPPTISGEVSITPTNLPANVKTIQYLVDGKPVASGVINTNTLSNGDHTVETKTITASGKTIVQTGTIVVHNPKTLKQLLVDAYQAHDMPKVAIGILVLTAIGFTTYRFDLIARLRQRLYLNRR